MNNSDDYRLMAARPSEKPNTITDDVSNLANRLGGLYDRISKLGAVLHGPVPREANVGKDVPGPVPSVRSGLDASFRVLTDIENELSRVEARL